MARQVTIELDDRFYELSKLEAEAAGMTLEAFLVQRVTGKPKRPFSEFLKVMDRAAAEAKPEPWTKYDAYER